MERILKELNEVQKEATVNFEGPSLVIAGAGSGKTRVLTYRIAYMLSKGVDPASILALTFTNKAAREMKERIAGLVGSQVSRRLWMGTFHSIFSRILRLEAEQLGFKADYTIYDTQDSRNLIKTIIKELKLDDKIYKPNEIQGRISHAKNNLITAGVYASNSTIQATDDSTRRPRLHEIYTRYAARCKKAGAMDFDDLLLNTNILFRDFPDSLEKYKRAFEYILVDEYQDTNYSQYLIIKKLAGERHNICVVGDDAQSIYSFRGARIENILSFQKDFPETVVYKLEQNYRSTQTIVNAANSLISRNQDQIKKKVFSKLASGDKIEVVSTRTDTEEGLYIANVIKDKNLSDHIPFREFAILYRTNAQSRIFEESMRKMNIPYKVYGGISFFQRKEVKDLLAYFKLVSNPNDDESLKRIINYPLRGIGKTTLSKLETLAISQDNSIWEIMHDRNHMVSNFTTGTLNKLFGFVKMIREFMSGAETMEAFDLAYTIATVTGIMKELVTDKTPEGISRYENLEQLLNGVREFTENEENEGNTSLGAYLQTVSLYTDADTDNEEDKNRVTIMTIHSAKGLEFREVFLAGMEEELFPSHMSSTTQKELEEERRLFYVGLTRAMEKVYLTCASTRYKWGLLSFSNPSRFITEIDEQYLELPDNFGYSGNQRESSRNFGERQGYGRSWSGGRDQVHEKPSLNRNLTEIPEAEKRQVEEKGSEISEIIEGAWVEHHRFGKGKVIMREGVSPNIKATVDFGGHGTKQLLLKFARLKVIGK